MCVCVCLGGSGGGGGGKIRTFAHYASCIPHHALRAHRQVFETLNPKTEIGQRTRCLQVVAEFGSGKSTLVDELCNFMVARNIFRDIKKVRLVG